MQVVSIELKFDFYLAFYTLIPCSYVTRHTLATASDAQGVHITLGALINCKMKVHKHYKVLNLLFLILKMAF